jgi:hypothetical protein
MSRGYIIVAQNNESIDYIKCAEVLAKSIKNCMPSASVTLLTDLEIQNSIFDNIVLFPHGDKCINTHWKLANDWQVYDASPYTYTIKIEADIYIPRSIDHWWEFLKHRDLFINSTIRNYQGHVSFNKNYRATLVRNNLPDTYNAITYFRKSRIASKFFKIVRDIFENWSSYQEILSINNKEPATTDVVYAIAARIIGEEHCIISGLTPVSMTHMKKDINFGINSDWTKEYVYEIHKDILRINTIPQLYPLHYYIKHFAFTLDKELND